MKKASMGIRLCGIGAFIFGINQISASIFSINRSFDSYYIFLKSQLSIFTNIVALIYSLIGIIFILIYIVEEMKQ